MYDKDKFFDSIAAIYRQGELDDKLDEAFGIAANSGKILLPGDQRLYTDAENGAYNLDDLLLPLDLETETSITDAYQAGDEIFPKWFVYDLEKHYFQYNRDTFCLEFIRSHHLKRRKGKFIIGGKAVRDTSIKKSILRSLLIVRKDAGGLVDSTFDALSLLCEDEEPVEKRDRLSLDALRQELINRGYDVRYNVIVSDYETIGSSESGRTMSFDDLIVTLHDALSDTYKGTSFDILTQYVPYCARENQYNPVLELLSSAVWDGIDRLPQLYSMIGVENDDLSRTLIRKWLYQAVALLFNDVDNPFGADGCLVFNGAQGVGKTSLFRHLAMRDAWFGEGCSIDDRDKDTVRRIVTKWISELGEVESTLKSDISKLKAFVSASVDRYRLPYGRTDVVAPRLTSLCATCNSDRYLIDPTGNRRWWSVPFNRTLPRNELLSLDTLQLWAQIYAVVSPLDYSGKASCFRLTEDEKQALAKRNGEYEKPVKGQIEVEDILYKATQDNLKVKKMTVSDFKKYWEVLRPYSAQQISTALKACGVELKRLSAGSYAELPMP